MCTVQRLKLAGAVITLAGVIVSAHVWGDSPGGRGQLQPSGRQDAAPEVKLGEALAAGKFAQNPVVTYTTVKGETIIGAQVQPALEVPPARPRDLAVLIDASASQAGSAFDMARRIAHSLSETLGAEDRLSIWVVSVPAANKCLTRDGGFDFQAPKSEKVTEALGKLDNVEYPAGATDLKVALKSALESFESREARQSAILLLGDGESAYSPVSNPERYQIAQEMIARKIAFFAVPLGAKLNPANLHGFASSTGGAIVRLSPAEQSAEMSKRLLNTVSAPILYPTKFTLGDGVLEAFPTKLPPLRGDSPTLVVGKVKSGAENFALSVQGTVANKAITVETSQKIAKAETDNFFLASMFDQWSKADNKAAPALIRADRALAYAEQQSRLTLEEYVTTAHWALSDSRFDVADRMFNMALKVDPNDFDANNGLKVVQKLKDGKITRQLLLQEIIAAKKKSEGLKVTKVDGKAVGQRIDFSNLVSADEEQQPPANPTLPKEGDLIKEQVQRQALAEQQITGVIDETIRRAKSLINTDPDGAYELLKRQKASLVDNPEIGPKAKQTLISRLDNQLRDVDNRGRAIKQRIDEETQRKILALAIEAKNAAATSLQEKIRERIRSFVTLMDQARYEEAYKESQILRQEAISKGQPVPIEATAAYNMSLTANNLRELEELKRLREERFLLTMMQVEKSHVPYPDEPPVHFPPATVWQELSKYRKARWDGSGLGPEVPVRTKKLIESMSKVVDIEKPFDGDLKDILEYLSDRYELTFIIDPVAFKNADPPLDNVDTTKVKLPKLPGVTLSTVLRMLLSPLGGTYLVRRDYIEITTAKEAIKEKTVREYEVADLVIPIPNSVNQSSLNQNLQVLGGSFSFGAAGSPFQQQGGLGFLGIGGIGGFGGLGGLGGLGGGLGGLGGLGLGGGGLGLGGGLGGGNAGQAGNFVGFGGFGGQGNNLGAGGGLTGFGGGQLGQFGNLGGQFGLQGGDQSAILIQLITDTIARGEWTRLPANVQRQLGNQPGMADTDDDTPVVPAAELNSLGYYPPARALVVRATSRIHIRAGGGLLNPRPAGMGMANGRPDVLVIEGKRNDDGAPKKPADDAAVAKNVDPVKEYNNAKPNKIVKQKDWQQAFAKEKIRDKAGWVIAICDFLAGVKEFGQAADVLKVALRDGMATEPWAFEALAIALQQSGATQAEIERVKLSAIDLDPKDPQAYLRAARAVAESGQSAKAIEFCRRAASLQPDMAEPYVEALAFIDNAKSVDSDATAWAVGNLLGRDWTVDNELFHNQAKATLATVKTKLTSGNKAAEAQRIQDVLNEEHRRDLVIELRWDGDADLDLRVIEPIGTTCSSLQRQTPAGSLLTSDSLKERMESYVVREAFNGSYEVKVDRVWGRTINGKAQVKVIRNQGTPDQLIEYFTVNLEKPEPLKVSLTGGRRTGLAVVPPPQRHPYGEKVASSLERSINRLRALADPNFTGTEAPSRSRVGGVAATGASLDPTFDLNGLKPAAQMSMTKRVDSLTGTADYTTKTSVKTNAKGDTEIRVKMSPVFETANKLPDAPVIENPLIPGTN